MKRIIVGVIVTLILTIVAFTVACSSVGYSLKINAYHIERTNNGVVFNYKFIVYGWKDSQASVEFVNPLNISANVILTVAGIRKNVTVYPHESAVLGTFVLADNGPLYFNVVVLYKRYLGIGEIGVIGSDSLSVYSSGHISVEGISTFAFVEATFAGVILLILFLFGKYGEVFEVYNSWTTLFILWIILAYMIGINGPLIFDLSIRYPFTYYNIASKILNSEMITKILAVFTGVLGFYSSSESRVDVFEHLMSVYNKKFIIFKIIIIPILTSLLLIGLAVGVVLAGGGLTISRSIGYWQVFSDPLAVFSYVILVYLFIYILSGGIMFITQRPMLALIISILIILFVSYPMPFDFNSDHGPVLSPYAPKFLVRGLASIIIGLLLIMIKWIRR